MPPKIFDKMFTHVLTDKGLDLFDADYNATLAMLSETVGTIANLLNKISWDDILDKLDYDVSLGQWGYCNDPKEGMIPTIVAEGFYQPDSFIQLC